MLGRVMNLTYEDASPAAIIAGSNHFEVVIAMATTLFGVTSGAALATKVGVLTEVTFNAHSGATIQGNQGNIL